MPFLFASVYVAALAGTAATFAILFRSALVTTGGHAQWGYVLSVFAILAIGVVGSALSLTVWPLTPFAGGGRTESLVQAFSIVGGLAGGWIYACRIYPYPPKDPLKVEIDES